MQEAMVLDTQNPKIKARVMASSYHAHRFWLYVFYVAPLGTLLDPDRNQSTLALQLVPL